MFYWTQINLNWLRANFPYNGRNIFDGHNHLWIFSGKIWCKSFDFNGLNSLLVTNAGFFFFSFNQRRTFDAIAAIGLLGASCCLIKFINDGYSLNDGLGERSIMEKAITKIGDIVDEAMDPKIMDEVFNKYKRSNVYQKYMISGVSTQLITS